MAATELGIRLSVDGADAASSAIKGVSSSMDGLGSSAGNATAGLKKAASDLEKVEMSAKATAAALRNVPAQFTDIAVGLASGQAPLTVLLQQGGQLKDMFGGVGNAAKALGGYMASLITPFSAAAAAAGTLGYAYYAGAKEIDAYNKALILTGNAIGLTSGQLQDMASNMARISGTQGKAAETLAAFASAGDVGADSLQKFSQAAINFEKATGSAVEETVKQFSKLGEKPLEASIKLNESTNFLTMSIYQQIKALEEQGKHTEAAQVAQDAYADTINQRAGQITANLGTIERGWLAIVSASKQAWDAIKDIGREDSVGAKIIKAQQEMVDILKNGDLIKYGGLSRADAISAQITKIRQLQEDEKLGNLTAKAQSQQAERVKAEIAWDALRKKHLSDQEKMELAITDAIEKGNAARKSQAEILDEINHIIDKGPKVEKGRAKSEAVERFSNELTATKQWLATQEKMIQESYSAQQKSIEESYKSQEISAAQYYSRQLANDEKALRDSEKVRAEAKARFDAEMAERVATTEARKPSQARTTALENLRNEAAQFALAQEAARQKERNSIAAHGDDMAREIDKQSQKVTESVDTYIADMQRRAQADAALVAAREAMAGQSPEIIAGMAAEMKVRADAAKILEQTAKAYAKAAEDARTFEDELASNFADGKEATNAERLLLETLQSSAKRARRSLIELGGAVDTTALDASVTATTASIKKQTDEVAKEVQKTLVDGIMSAGKDGGAGLRKAIEDVLITRPFRIVVEAMLQPVSTAIAQGIMGQTLGTGANVGGISSALNAASLAASTFGSNALEAAKAVTIEGASFGDVVSIISSDFAAGKFAAGIGGAVGAAAPFAIAAVAAQSLFNAMQGSVTPTGTFLYGGQGRFGGRQDFNQSGGVFGGGNTKNSSWFDPAPEVAKYMGAVESTITTSVKGWASAIGLSADAVDSYSKQVEVSIGGLDAKGTKDAIDKAFAGFGDDLTKAAYGLSSDTLKTLATNLQGVNAVFESVGMSALEASMGSAELATSIVTAAGSLDNLSKITGAAYDAMTSPAQKAADSAGKLDKAFASLGVSTPKTVQDLVQLAKAQDLTSDAGRKAAVGILSLLPALQQVQDGVKAAREAMLRDAGINNGDISSIVKKGLIEGNLKNAGGEISDTIMAGIQNALYGKMADAITNSFTDEMLAPLLEAMQKGKSLPEALAAVDWTQVKSKFQQTVDDVSAIFNNSQVTSGIGALKGAIQDLFSTSSYSIPKGWILAKDDTTKAATGGLITGPGTGTSDSVPAMLSNGEYVIKASSAAKLGTGFLNAINAGQLPKTVNRAEGGMVWDDPVTFENWQAISGTGNTTINVNSGYFEGGLIADSRNAPSSKEAATDYTALESDAAQTYIDALRAMGEVYTANTLALAKATEGFDALHVAMYREIEAGKVLVSMREALAQSQKDYAASEVELLKAKGNNAGAAALQRSLDLADVSAKRASAQLRLLDTDLSENEKSYQTAIVATADATAAQYDLTKAREAEISAAGRLLSATKDVASSRVKLLQAGGSKGEADANQRAIDLADTFDSLNAASSRLATAGLSETERAVLLNTVAADLQTVAQYDLGKALEKTTEHVTAAVSGLKNLQDSFETLNVSALTALGDKSGAGAAQKAITLKPVNEAAAAAQTLLNSGTVTDADVKAGLELTVNTAKLADAQYDLNTALTAGIAGLTSVKGALEGFQETGDDLVIQKTRLTGDDEGADVLQRSSDLKDVFKGIAEATATLESEGITPLQRSIAEATVTAGKAAVAQYDRNKDLTDEIEILGRYKSAQAEASSTNIELLKVTGQTAKAAELELASATKGFNDIQIATVRQTNATKGLIAAYGNLSNTENMVTNSRIGLLTAKGDTAGAAALQRELDIAPYVKVIADSTIELGKATTETEKETLRLTIATNQQAIGNYDLAKSIDIEADAAQKAKSAADELAGRYARLASDLQSAKIALLRASGQGDLADQLEFEQATEGFDALHKSMYTEAQTVKQLTAARERLNQLTASVTANEIELMRARGQNDSADAAQLSSATTPYYTQREAAQRQLNALITDQRDQYATYLTQQLPDTYTPGYLNNFNETELANIIKNYDAGQGRFEAWASNNQIASADMVQGLVDLITTLNGSINAEVSNFGIQKNVRVINEGNRLQDQIDELTKTPAEMVAKALELTNDANKALFITLQNVKTEKVNQGWREKIDVLLDPKKQREIDMQHDLSAATDDTTKALIKQYYAQLDFNESISDLTKSLQGFADDTFSLELKLKRAQGSEIIANALERGAAIKPYQEAITKASSALAADKGKSLLTQSQVQALNDAITQGNAAIAAYDRNKALEGELRIIELQDEAMQQYLNSQKAVSDAQKAYADVLKSTIETMQDFIATLDGGASPLQNLSTARANFQTVAGRAASGDTSAYKDLTPAARAFLDLSKNYSRSIQDYQRDEAKVRATLNAVIRVNQNELDKLPKEIAEAADPTKQAWKKLQDALAKEADASIVLAALQVDQEASKRRLRTAEETLSDRYIEAVFLLDETKKTSLLEAFKTAVESKVNDATLPNYPLTFDLEQIWGDKIAGVLPNTPLSNADLNALIASKFPGLTPSDFYTQLTPTQLSDLIAGKFPKLEPSNLIGVPANMVGIVNDQISKVIPIGFAGDKFDAKAMMQAAIDKAMGLMHPSVAPDLSTTATNNVLNQANSAGFSGTGTSVSTNTAPDLTTPFMLPPSGSVGYVFGRDITAKEVADLLGVPEYVVANPTYLSGILSTYTDPAQYAYQKSFGDKIDETIAIIRAYGKAKAFPGFAVGTNYVPHDMLAQIHQGEAIIPAPFNPERYGRASGNDALVEEIKALREEVSRLRAEQMAGQNAIAAHTRKTAQALIKFDTDGMPETRT